MFLLAITYHTSLLKPFFIYKRTSALALFFLIFFAACLVYGLIQHFLLGWPLKKSLLLALFCGGSVQLGITYYILEPVMFGELISHRLFYRYAVGVRYSFSLLLIGLAGGLIARSVYVVSAGRQSQVLFFLPLAWIAVYPDTGILIPATAVGLIGCLAAQLSSNWSGNAARLAVSSGWRRFGNLVKDDRVVAWTIFAVALIMRATYAVRTATAEASQGFIWDDAAVYERGAQELSYEGYCLFLRAIYAVTGHSFVAVRLAQSVLGAWICVLVFRLAKMVIPRPAALLAAVVSLLDGALLCVPALEARETLLTLLLLCGVYYSLKWSHRDALRYDVFSGLLFGALGLVKTIALPAGAALVYIRLRNGRRRWLNAAAIATIALLTFSTKAIVNRPLNIPVGRSGMEYAAMSYFAGNHPFTHDEEWFNLTREQYLALRTAGFRVGQQAGEPQAIAAWKQRYPRIAYCDRTTFESNTWILLRYNLSHPRRLAYVTSNNFLAFFLGPFHHHLVFDTIHLLNESAFSMLSRIYWLGLAVLGWAYTSRTVARGSTRHEALIAISLVITYFVVVYTIMIGATIYSIPIIPYLTIFQGAGIYALWRISRECEGSHKADTPLAEAAEPLEKEKVDA